MINMGYQVVPWHIHGWHFTVVGKDTHVSPFLKIAALLSDKHEHDKKIHGLHEIRNENFTIGIASGETYDLLITADDKRPQYRNYIVKGQDGFPSLCSQLSDLVTFANTHPELVDGSPVFDIPTEPVNCSNPQTVNYVDICAGIQGDDRYFPQFYPAHNHDDYKVTNDGAYPGGQLVLFQIDAPDTVDHNDDESCD